MEDVAYKFSDYLEQVIVEVTEQRNTALDDLAAEVAEKKLFMNELESLRSDYQALAEDYYNLWEGSEVRTYIDEIERLDMLTDEQQEIIELQELHIANVQNALAEAEAKIIDLTTVKAAPAVQEPVLLLEGPTEPLQDAIPEGTVQDYITTLPYVGEPEPRIITLPETSMNPPVVVQLGSNESIFDTIPSDTEPTVTTTEIPLTPPIPETFEPISDIIDSISLPTTIDVGDVAQPEPTPEPVIEEVEQVAPLTENNNPLI
jgi:hypothetical protein